MAPLIHVIAEVDTNTLTNIDPMSSQMNCARDFSIIAESERIPRPKPLLPRVPDNTWVMSFATKDFFLLILIVQRLFQYIYPHNQPCETRRTVATFETWTDTIAHCDPLSIMLARTRVYPSTTAVNQMRMNDFSCGVLGLVVFQCVTCTSRKSLVHVTMSFHRA